jgi:TonB-dependent receptor
LDSLYGKLTNDRNDYALATSGTNSLTGNITGTQIVQSANIVGNTLVAADYTGVDLRSEHNIENDTTNFYQTVLNGAYKITDKLTAKFTGGYSRSVYSLPVFAKTYLESKDHSIDVNDTSDSPSNTYDTITNVNNWNLMRADAQQNGITSEYKTGKGDLIYSFDNGSALKVGAMYKDFSNSGWQRYNKQFYNTGNVDTVIPNSFKGLFTADSYAPYVVGDVYSLYNYIGKSINLTSAYNQPGSDYQVSEKTMSAYAQYDIDTYLFGYVTRANVGVRYYSTDLTSSGTQTVGAVLAPVTAKHNYHDFLPAANLAINITDNLLVRLSADRNVSRPALSDLAAAATVNNSAIGGSISAGNPNLKPMTANSAEASVEYYFGKSGSLSAGVFYKDMESFVVSQSSTVTYGSTGYPLSYLLPGQDGSILYTYTRPINSKGADIAGVELAAQHDFDFLPAPFDKFGVNVNMTYADGYQDNSYTANGATSIISVPLYNLSKYSVNSTLYYATKQWDARVSLAYRSDYLINAGSNGNIGEGMGATTNVDFAGHYNLGDHITLVVEGINLTNQANTQWADIHVKRPEVYTTSGRTFTFGAVYRF